jgi:hypothetical protein
MIHLHNSCRLLAKADRHKIQPTSHRGTTRYIFIIVATSWLRLEDTRYNPTAIEAPQDTSS